MAKHSPAPWSHKRRAIYDNTGFCIAETYAGAADDLDQAGANDALIAASPELLDALRIMVQSLADCDEEGLIEHTETMMIARAAIAKATGGAA